PHPPPPWPETFTLAERTPGQHRSCCPARPCSATDESRTSTNASRRRIRSPPFRAAGEILEEPPTGVSDRGGGVRSRGERRPEGRPHEEEMIPMAQYVMSVLFGETDGLATPEEDAAIDVFNERLQADGQWVFAGGLAAPGTATVVDGRDGEP